MIRAFFASISLLFALSALAAPPTYGPRLEGFEYPHPVKVHAFESQQQKLEMIYLDVAPKTPNGRTVVLFHGKNFCAATWEGTIAALTEAGFRVVALDQIGFCKSSRPTQYQFTFQQLATNSKAVLDAIGVKKAIVMGHSMGGMLATRFALMFPAQVERLVMVNPIGLEDWAALGVPYRTVDAWYAGALKTSAEGIKRYQQSTYYNGTWRPEFDRWVQMRAGMFRGPGKTTVAWMSAVTANMIATQPVVHDFKRLKVPALLLIGEKDNTALGKDAAPPAVRATLGDYSKLGPATVARIPDATLVTFPDLGHSPQIQAPDRFHKTLIAHLTKAP